jgi:hypothetical protein
MPAGHILVVGLVCLVLGWLLNAQGIKKTAYSQSLGWQRDIAVFFAKPMASISHFLHTDRPRAWLQDALGRKGDDDISTKLPSPTTVARGVPPPTTAKEVFGADRPLAVWVGGDSLAVTPGESILSFIGASQTVRSVSGVDGQIATGLARPEIFNWPAHLKEVTDSLHPRVIVLTIGSNDDQSLTGAPGGGTVGPFGSAEWEAEYRRRVGGLMDQVVSSGQMLVWIGVPPIRNFDRSEQHYKVLNEIYKSEAAKRPGRVLYVDIYSMFLDPGGGYADYLPSESGEQIKVRADDGIHFTRAGGNRIAGKVIETLDHTFDLRSQSATTPTSAPPSSAKSGKKPKASATTKAP